MIEGLTAIDFGQTNARMAGSKFALPATFDSVKYASKWAEEGPEVEEARQEQVISSAGMKAQGWEVFRTIDLEATKKLGEKGDKAPVLVPVKRVVGKKVFILMFRPKALQQAVNKLYANESRERLNREIVGESATVNEAGDPGILTNQDLKRVSRSYDGSDEPRPIPKGGGKLQDPNRASELVLQ
jgi:hypothetical protein